MSLRRANGPGRDRTGGRCWGICPADISRGLVGLALFAACIRLDCMMLAGADEPVRTKAQAIEQIERWQGEVRIDGEHPDEPVWMVDLSATDFHADMLELLKLFPGLEVLHLHDLPINDSHLAAIGRLRSLHELSLDGTRITDAGLKSLRTLTDLEKLSISRTGVTNAGLSQLAPLKKLKELTCFETAVTDQAVKDQFAGRIQVSPGGAAEMDVGNRSRLPLPAPLVEVEEEHLTADPAEDLARQYHVRGVAVLQSVGRNPTQRRQALDLLEAAVANDLSQVLYRIDLADAYVSSGNPLAVALACDLYDEILTDLPDADSILARLADAYLSLRNFAAARDVLRRRSADSPTTPVQWALLAVLSRDYTAGARSLREARHPLGRALADALEQLALVDRSQSTSVALPPSQGSTVDPWQRMVETQTHLEKLTALVSAASEGLVDDRQQLADVIDELNRCLELIELSASQVRFYAPQLSLGVSSQILVDELAVLRSADFRPETVAGDWPGLQRWQALATICFWKAIHDATQDVVSSNRRHAEDCVTQALEKVMVDQPSEHQLLAAEIGGLAHAWQTARGTPLGAAVQQALRDLHAHALRRERQRLDQRMALAFLLRSVSSAHRSETDMGGSQLLALFKLNPVTGFTRTGGPVWIDRADSLDLWLLGGSAAVRRAGAVGRRSSVKPLFPQSNGFLDIVSLSAGALRESGPPDAPAEWLPRVRNEVALRQLAGELDEDIREWLIGELRQAVVEHERQQLQFPVGGDVEPGS